MKSITLILSLALLILGCGQEKKKSSTIRQNVSAIYSSTHIAVKAYYFEGAEPYTDNILSFKLWDVLQVNLESLFSGRSPKPTFHIPKTLIEMSKIEIGSKDFWSVDDIMNLAQRQDLKDPKGKTTFHVFFVNGRAKDNPNIIGFHVSGTNVMAIFKDVIRSSGESTLVPKYVEQATIVHELGHAFGLVNNGLPMAVPHQDSAHGAHCDDTSCVMYYANEGATSMMNFVKNNIMNSFSFIMFDEKCLKDSREY